MARLHEIELRRIAYEVLAKNGLTENEVAIVAEAVIDAEMRGRKEHGLAHIPRIVQVAKKAGRGEISVIHENSFYALVDGADNLGPVVAKFAMDLCITKAKSIGLGLVGVRNPDPFLLAGYYSRMALKEEMIGIAIANSRARIPPYGGIDPVFGVNPISIAIPSASQPFVLDMAISRITVSEINLAKKLGRLIPRNLAIDRKGLPTRDPAEALDGALLPIDIYKGYGLALAIEILAGPLIGAKAGKTVLGTRGYLFLVIDPKIFVDNDTFHNQVAELIQEIKSSRKRGTTKEILIPGELRDRHLQIALAKGVDVDDEILNEIKAMLNP